MKAPVRVVLVGAAGRMGQAIVKLAQSESNIDIVAQCDRGDALEPAMQKCDVVLDFSHADAIEGICRTVLQHRQPLVIGTTGHSSEQRRIIGEAGKSLPIVFASNFSVGVNALFSLTRKTAEILGPEFDLEIVETHHRMKKDAPSGTARTLAEILRTVRKLDDQVPIQSIRQGEVVGDHTVRFAGPGERLELTHRATSREIFARGALRAAQWIIGKPAGLYSMQDVLGL
jgi:4-hydroxy-tetrahydrodipicolinate reductase